jgi:hypothetical protein
LKKARFAVEHTKVKARAVFELKRIVDDIRAEMHRSAMMDTHPYSRDQLASQMNDHPLLFTYEYLPAHKIARLCLSPAPPNL